MQYTGSSTTHNQNVKRKYAKRITSNGAAPSTIIHQTSHRKCELLSSESDISSEQIQLRNKLNQNRNNVHSGYVRRKGRWNRLSVGTLLLVLICLVVKLESVIGALALNYNSVNYYDNSSYAVLEDDSDVIVPFLDGDDVVLLSLNRLEDKPLPPSSRPSVIYQNEFAVFIPDGVDKANQIAEKHGFTNMGQVSKKIQLCVQCYVYELPQSYHKHSAHVVMCT